MSSVKEHRTSLAEESTQVKVDMQIDKGGTLTSAVPVCGKPITTQKELMERVKSLAVRLKSSFEEIKINCIALENKEIQLKQAFIHLKTFPVEDHVLEEQLHEMRKLKFQRATLRLKSFRVNECSKCLRGLIKDIQGESCSAKL